MIAMLKDHECAERYEESMRACEPYRTPVTMIEYSWASAPARVPDGYQPTHADLSVMQAFIGSFEQLDLTPNHYFAPGMYGRELPIPADSYVIGKIHKHQHITILMSGTATINTDKGMQTITGPHVWVSQVNAKRILHTVTDCVFFTVHATNETDLDLLEAELIEPETLSLTAQGVIP